MEVYEENLEDTDDISTEGDIDDIFFLDNLKIFVDDNYDVYKERVPLTDKEMSISFMGKIENVRRFTFAEDLVSFIALEFHGLAYNTRLNKDSEFLFSPFCENVRHAARIIRKQINNAITSSFEVIEDLSKTHKECYVNFVDAVLIHYSQKGLKAGQFFYFCVYVAELAAKCYRFDFEEVFDFAVYAILDAFCIFTGRRYELINFAKTIAKKSDHSFNQANEMEIFRINLNEFKVTTKSDKHEIINKLKLSLFKNFGNSQENELAECGDALEQLSLEDKYDKCEISGNFEFHIEELIEKLIKPFEPNVNDSYLSLSRENSCIYLIEKVHDEEDKSVLCPTENEFFEGILQEILSTVNFEASLFSEIYASSKKDRYSKSQDGCPSTNTNDKLEPSTCSDFQKIGARDSHSVFKDLVPHDCIEKEVETLVNACITPNLAIVETEKEDESDNPSDTSEHAGVKFPNDKSNVFKIEKNQFFFQRSVDDKIKSWIAESELKSDDKDTIIDYNTTKEVEENLIEKETGTFKEAAVISNSKFKQEEIDKTLEDFSDTHENLNFQNNELEKLDTVQHPLACENQSENDNKLEENFKQLECRSTDDLYCPFDDKSVLPRGTEDQQIIDFFAIYKSEGEIDEENLKVLKGDTILFAEDFVKYIMKEFYGISYTEPKFDGIRCFSCNAFNQTVQEVLNFLHDKSETLNRVAFDIISNIKELNADCYRKYVATVLSHCTEDGLNSDAFLYFCLHFTELAAKLYMLDIPIILDFAICSILDAFCLLKDDWCEFGVATEKVLEVLKTKTVNHCCTGCKIRRFVDNFEEECVNVILDTFRKFIA